MSISPNLAAARRPWPQDSVRLAAERREDQAAVAGLVERAFGPGRYAKTSERLREGNRLRADLSFCAFAGAALIGTVRQWPLRVGAAEGLFLGPIAVEADWRKHGVGGALISRCREAAQADGQPYILLIGDLPIFGPHGFEPAPARAIEMPAPVDPLRILLLPLNGTDPAGIVGRAQPPRAGASGA